LEILVGGVRVADGEFEFRESAKELRAHAIQVQLGVGERAA
jgi:hypothetical protein